ncbi:MAG TPA: cobalamin-binding protein [Candidatus Limnocylindrales bacterium]|nr:cobalamin-binding protein [Candidatus Limnocylindrales bacterium]
MRIVSLLPSATEIVFALGLGDQLVGVTHECDWPPEAATKPAVTRATHDLADVPSRQIHDLVRDSLHGGSSLYALDEALLAELRPDLIITQELCAVCAVSYRRVSEAVRAIDAPTQVVSLEPSSIEGIFNTITTVGALTGVENRAVRLVGRLRSRLGRLERRVERRREHDHVPVRVVAVEWLDPPFAVGHWVPEQIRRAGGWDLLGRDGEPSVETTWEAVRDVEPEMLVLMPCGFHLADAVAEWARTPRPEVWKEIEAVRRRNVFVVDGSAYFSRPGPRVIDGIATLCELFDPDAFVETSPPGAWTPVFA